MQPQIQHKQRQYHKPEEGCEDEFEGFHLFNSQISKKSGARPRNTIKRKNHIIKIKLKKS